MALGLNSVVSRLRHLSPGARVVLSRLVPFAAVASAGALNVFLMRSEEIRQGIDVFPVASSAKDVPQQQDKVGPESLGKSRKAALIAVSETGLSRVLNATPIMVLPPLILVRLQRTEWLKKRPRLTLPLNIGIASSSSLHHRRTASIITWCCSLKG